MKRLAGLLIVFVLASTANATISLGIDGSGAPDSVELVTNEVLTIEVYSDNTSAYLAYIIRETDGAGGLYNLVELWREPPVIIQNPDIVEPGWGDGFTLSYMPLSGGSSGIHFTVDYKSPVVGSAVISLWMEPDETTAVDTLGITVVPEPVTMSLLALGGALVLIRKRKR